MYEHLQIAKIVGTHGVHGEVRVIPLTDNPDRFKKLKWVYIDKKGTFEKYNIKDVKFLKNLVVLKFEGIDTPESAAQLKELFLLVDRDNAVKLPKDSFFICDLIGAKVYENGDQLLGELTDVLQTGSNDVFVVKGIKGKDILIPALKSVINEVLSEEGIIRVTLPEGLLEDEI